MRTYATWIWDWVSGESARSPSDADPWGVARVLERRWVVVVLAFLTALMVVLGRVAWLQVVQGPAMLAVLERAARSHDVIPPRRGPITFRDGSPIAMTRFTSYMDIEPVKLELRVDVTDERGHAGLRWISGPQIHERVVDLLTEVFPDRSDLAEIVASGLRWLRLTTRMNEGMAQRFRSSELRRLMDRNRIRGIRVSNAPVRNYPEGDIAGHIVGGINYDPATNEPWGRRGLEYRYNESLAGEPVWVPARVDGRGRQSRAALAGAEPVASDGHSIETTLHRGVQYQMDRLADDARAMHRALRVSIVLLEVGTGEIWAMGQSPRANPSMGEVSDELGLSNFATELVIEPGSTFKVVAMVGMAEREGANWLSIPFDTATTHVGRHPISDVHPHPSLTGEMVIVKSSNVGSYRFAQRIGRAAFLDVVFRLGFGQPTGIEVAMEERGQLPYVVMRDGEWVPNTETYLNPRRTPEIRFANNAYGYGLSVTPLQSAVAYATIANGGVWVPPTLIRHHRDALGNEVPPAVRRMSRQAIDPRAAEISRRVLARTTQRGGTGTRAVPTDIPGMTVAGKTGTAKKLQNGRYANHYIASFVGFFPVESPRFVITVVVDGPSAGVYYGGDTAAPVVAEAIRRIHKLGVL